MGRFQEHLAPEKLFKMLDRHPELLEEVKVA